MSSSALRSVSILKELNGRYNPKNNIYQSIRQIQNQPIFCKPQFTYVLLYVNCVPAI